MTVCFTARLSNSAFAEAVPREEFQNESELRRSHLQPSLTLPTIPARLHALLARDADTAVVIRRGPSRHTAVIGWNRKTDRFKIGQWLYGRIYERRCDLSPDGKHLIYFAMNGRWGSAVRGSWTAISKAPYLKALTLFAKGDCWHGGGLFQSSREYWLNDGYGHELQENGARLSRTTHYPWHEYYGGECLGVYYIRLQRDGWVMRHTSPGGTGGRVSLFEKRLNGHWRLHKLAHATIATKLGRGCYFDTHQLFNARTAERVLLLDWEWAEVDGGRIVWARNGRLYSGRVGSKGLHGETALYDFNSMKFERIAAPY